MVKASPQRWAIYQIIIIDSRYIGTIQVIDVKKLKKINIWKTKIFAVTFYTLATFLCIFDTILHIGHGAESEFYKFVK